MNWQVIRAANVQEKLADVAAVGSISTAGWTWLSNANEILQIIATLVAIAAGLYAIRYHRRKYRELDEDSD